MSKSLCRGFMNSASDSQGQSPLSPRWLHVALLGIALVGWLIFILACVEGPGWSPDSSKVLFSYFDSDGGRYAVALYDVAKHKTKLIFERPTKEEDDNLGLLPAWQSDGSRALILVNEMASESDKHCVLLSLPVGSNGVPRTYDLGKAKDCWYRPMVMQQSDKLYLGDEDGLNWVNLATGETGSTEIKGGPGFLHERNGQIVYMRGTSRPVAGAKEKNSDEEGIEFGQINLADATLKPSFTIWQTQFPDVKFGDSMSAAWEPSGSHVALIGVGEDSDRILMMDENKGPTGTIDPNLGVKPVRIGNLLWSHDGKTFYSAAVNKGSKEKTCDFSLAEIPVSGASGRLTRIASFSCDDVSKNDIREHLEMILPLALSPDDNWIAATPSNCAPDKFAAVDHALFLIDLRRKERRITRVSFPTLPKTGSPSAKSAP